MAEAKDANATLQGVIDAVLRRMGHRSLESVQDRLVTAIADAGLPAEPRTWVESTAEEIAAGRRVVVDARFQDDQRPDPR